MKKPYYIDFPQEHFEGQMHKYRCAFCKQETTAINGKLEGHLPTCEYRVKLEKAGFECESAALKRTLNEADDFD